jgi:nitrate/TMAO reductase-like tetraheme cytochrome c subunit
MVLAASALFSFFLLFAIDLFAGYPNPYVGILAYMVAPIFFILGIFLTFLGALIRRRTRRRAVRAAEPLAIKIDLSRPRDRRIFGVFAAVSVGFLFLSAFGSYQTYHFTESVQFCGQACHTVMGPELTTYENSPHARVACTECHIGPGATWFVKSKISGTYQVYAVLFNKFPRPIETPIKNLRPAQQTCEQCHWPKKFIGNLDRTFRHFLADEKNTPYAVRMLIKVGGADATHGPVGGIHWHMNVANKMEYIASDKSRQTIPWVRMTDYQGVVTEFSTPDFKNKIDPSQIRRMDCMDCHNRPSHNFQPPDIAVDLAIALGQIDRALPFIKKHAVEVLTQPYATQTEGLEKIATKLASYYPDDARTRQAIGEVQRIYRQNFFPEMKANWKVYPDDIGHRNWAGCFRCHDGQHKTADGKETITDNCNACHVILAQGSGPQLDQLDARGQPFAHPGGDYGDLKCYECHTGESL